MKQVNKIKFFSKTGLLAVALTSLMAVNAFAQEAAGGTSPGGGDAVKNSDGTWSLLDLKEKMATNYFDPFAALEKDTGEFGTRNLVADATNKFNACSGTLSIFGDESRFRKVNLLQIVWALATGEHLPHGIFSTSELRLFESRFGKQLIWVGTEKPLSNITDEGVVRISDEVTKEQLAAQKDGVVVVYLPIFKKMSQEDRAGLILHESILRFILKTNPLHYQRHGTSKIRELVKLVFTDGSEKLPQPVFGQYCDQDGSLFTKPNPKP